MFSCNVDGILNDLPGVAFIDKAADWKAAPIGGFNMPPEHSAIPALPTTPAARRTNSTAR
jgi:hypothetical protein